MLRDIAVNEFSTLRWNFQEDVVKYASQGINKIGVSRDKVSDFGVDAAADLLFEMKMSVSSVNWAGGFTGSDGRSSTASCFTLVAAMGTPIDTPTVFLNTRSTRYCQSPKTTECVWRSSQCAESIVTHGQSSAKSNPHSI